MHALTRPASSATPTPIMAMISNPAALKPMKFGTSCV